MTKQLIEIFSNLEPKKLLHQAFIFDATVEHESSNDFGRTDISPECESLQVAFLKLPLNKTFRPHRHIIHNRDMPMAQESWIVIRGGVEVTYYDLDDTVLKTLQIGAGSCTVTYEAGHNYKALTHDTVVYELKTGPYLGVEKDKTFLKS